MSIRKIAQFWAVIVNDQPLFTSVDFPYWAVEAVS